MIKTRLCDLLGIEHPVFQGGMAWVANASLAAAVSNAGGLGIIGAMSAPAQWVKEEIAKVREKTSKPFAVNIMLMSPHAGDIARTVIEEHVPIVTTGAGNPAQYMKAWIAAGIKVVPVVASVGIARYVEKRGAIAVVAEGCEAGGHIGDLTTMVLVPQVVDAVKIPVVAAGGIADGRGLAAALMLGASGVQMGTRFLTAAECTIHPNYKQRILAAQDIDTLATGRRLGHPVRALKTPLTVRFAKAEFDSALTNEEVESIGAGALRIAVQEGDNERGCFMAGQCAGLVKCEQTAEEIITQIFSEAEALFKDQKPWLM